MAIFIRTLVLLAVITQFCCLGSASFPEPQQEVIGQLDINYRFRPAVEDDLDDAATVICDAFSPGPVWRYAFPRYAEFKDYHWRCLRKEMGHVPHKTINASVFANVITVPDGTGERVVSIGVWNLIEPKPKHAADAEPDFSTSQFDMFRMHKKCSDNLDANMTRAKDLSKQFEAVEKHYVRDFPRTQMYLALLATHPDWDRHGFGAVQVEWGMDKMKGTGVPLTLLGTPAGWVLYDQLGFESVANITITTLDWPENLWHEYMRYETEKE